MLLTMTTLSLNRKARHYYEILETWQAGLVLLGVEVKAIKTGHINLDGAYVSVKNSEAFLINASIPAYQPANTPKDYSPTRTRKLLLTRQELQSLIDKTNQKGLTLVPLRVYTKQGYLKLEIGLGRGKKHFDQRQDIKQREAKREIDRAMRIKSESRL